MMRKPVPTGRHTVFCRVPLFSASSSDRVCGEDGTALSLLLSVPCYSAPDREPEYCNERVCLCACVCVCLVAIISSELHVRS